MKENLQANRIGLVERKIKQLYFALIRDVSQSAGMEKYLNKPFDINDYPLTAKKVEKGIRNLTNEMVSVINRATEKEWNYAVKANNSAIKSLLTNVPAELKSIYTSNNLDALKAFQTRKAGGLTLSERVWRYAKEYKGELELGLDFGIAEGKSADTLAKDLMKYLKEPEKLFRRVRDERGELVLSQNAKKYQQGRGSYKSSYKNAMRMTRTEINMAYRASDYEKNKSIDFVVGYEVHRSNHVYPCPLCDSLKGKYPKEFKFVGWHPQCYSDDSFVLTNRGWQLFKDVDKSDLIFSLNPYTSLPEWVGVSQMQQYHHKGKMVHFSSRNLDCLVTEEHEMVYLNKSDGKIKRKHAIEFGKGNGAFYRGCNWIGSLDSKIQIGTHVFDLGDFSEFMGYWLSDGSLIRNYQIKIAHQDGRTSKENIKDCCERMGFDVGVTSESVDIYSKDLNSYLRKYGVSYEKYVPLEIKNSNSSVIQRFLDAYIQCDGHERKARPFIGNRGSICYPKNSERTYFTTSNQMASDIGEMILKIGKRPSYSIDKIEGKKHKFKNGIYTINHDLYRISECNSLTATTFEKDLVDYHGEVYDLTLERNHIMYIRRNGKCFWGSNCRCFTTSILTTEDEFIEWVKKRGTSEETPITSQNEIKELPNNFISWAKANKERIATTKNMPYFIKDNFTGTDTSKWFIKPVEPAKVVAPKVEAKADANDKIIEKARTEMAEFSVSRDERMALFNYTASDYSKINDYLRNPDSVRITERRQETIKTMDRFIQKAPKVNGTTYRGIARSDEAGFNTYKNLKVGDIYTEKGYLSTTYNKNEIGKFTERGKYKIEMTIKGKNGVLIEDFSQTKKKAEILFPRNSKFKVISTRSQDGILKIELEEITTKTAAEKSSARIASRTPEQRATIQIAWDERKAKSMSNNKEILHANIETERLLIKKVFTSDNNERIMYEAYRKIEEDVKWLYKNKENAGKVVDMTIDITGRSVYLNRIDATGGKGYGFEAMKAILDDFKKAGYNEFTAYIESNNYSSQNMIKKLGGVIVKKGKEGDYWRIK